MNKTVDYQKLWMMICIFALLIVVFSQCESQSSLERSSLADVSKHEKNAELFEKKNEYLQQKQSELEQQLDVALKNRNKIDSKLQKVRIIKKVVVDTTIANKYLKKRYKNNSIQVVNDLIQFDVCRAENAILEKAIVNRDSIVVFTDSLYKNQVQVSKNLNDALDETKQANQGLNDLLLNEQKKLKKQKKQNFFLKAGIVALGGALLIK
jgi:septal ring factor EnvC (AmiA/AmiB activator)